MEDINVANDIALCRRCQQPHSYVELLNAAEVGPIDSSRPPKGMWLLRKPNGFEMGFSTRQLALAIFLIPFTLFWSGISLGGIYGTQIARGEFNLLFSLFGLPFVLGTCFLVPLALMSLGGKQVLTVDHTGADIFTGLGKIGWRRRFQWSEIHRVGIETSHGRKGRTNRHLVLEGDHPYRLASGQSEAKLQFALAFLRPLVGSGRI